MLKYALLLACTPSCFRYSVLVGYSDDSDIVYEYVSMYLCLWVKWSEWIVSVMLCAYHNAHSSVVGVVNETIIIIMIIMEIHHSISQNTLSFLIEKILYFKVDSSVSQNYKIAWVSEWKIQAQKDCESGKFGTECQVLISFCEKYEQFRVMEVVASWSSGSLSMSSLKTKWQWEIHSTNT